MNYSDIQSILQAKSEYLLDFKSETFKGQSFYKPSATWVEGIMANSDRNTKVLENLKKLYSHGRLANSGYLSILPVDQGIEHSAGASFAKNPMYFDPENIVKLALEAGCSGVASTLGVLGLVSKKYSDKIPLIVKLNHNELLTFPNKHDQIMFGQVQQAFDMGAVGVGATVYFGSAESNRQLQEVSEAFAEAHRLGMFTILWCYVRNSGLKTNEVSYEAATDITGQANHLGVTIEADIIKQKLPEINGGFKALNTGNSSYGKVDERMYSELVSEHPIDMAKYQVANCYMGKIPLISSGGASGENDLFEAVYTAVINKRAGGSGLILGRKAFQKDLSEGIKLLNAVQDTYLCKEITIA
jgi:fructose-bisphosphate aldolase, class I